MYKIFLQYPDSLRPTFPRIQEKLQDTHPCMLLVMINICTAVIACAVNVVCELARRSPTNYLGMVPIFYKLMTSLNNNWTVIKIVKLVWNFFLSFGNMVTSLVFWLPMNLVWQRSLWNPWQTWLIPLLPSLCSLNVSTLLPRVWQSNLPLSSLPLRSSKCLFKILTKTVCPTIYLC